MMMKGPLRKMKEDKIPMMKINRSLTSIFQMTRIKIAVRTITMKIKKGEVKEETTKGEMMKEGMMREQMMKAEMMKEEMMKEVTKGATKEGMTEMTVMTEGMTMSDFGHWADNLGYKEWRFSFGQLFLHVCSMTTQKYLRERNDKRSDQLTCARHPEGEVSIMSKSCP
jgi:hypothetical protein